jgi:hypothetical protein
MTLLLVIFFLAPSDDSWQNPPPNETREGPGHENGATACRKMPCQKCPRTCPKEHADAVICRCESRPLCVYSALCHAFVAHVSADLCVQQCSYFATPEPEDEQQGTIKALFKLSRDPIQALIKHSHLQRVRDARARGRGAR